LPKNGHGTNGHKLMVNRLAVSESKDDQIKLARLKGYEGDPCSECGQLTLVRSEACCKCDNCGASSGCS
jgi:ribonucleoside-diphosphate reductase alpha chain